MAKISTTSVTFTFHILTWNSYATNNHLMGCICATYEAIRSDRHGATEQTLQKLSNGRMIWKYCVFPRLLMGCIYVKYELNWSKKHWITQETLQNLRMIRLTLTFHLLTWKWCATHHHLMGCICATYKAFRTNGCAAMERRGNSFERPVWHIGTEPRTDTTKLGTIPLTLTFYLLLDIMRATPTRIVRYECLV